MYVETVLEHRWCIHTEEKKTETVYISVSKGSFHNIRSFLVLCVHVHISRKCIHSWVCVYQTSTTPLVLFTQSQRHVSYQGHSQVPFPYPTPKFLQAFLSWRTRIFALKIYLLISAHPGRRVFKLYMTGPQERSGT